MTIAQLGRHHTGTVDGGGVELFYRRFGAPGVGAPILILHGAGYYDSSDWLEVASALTTGGREVVAFDARSGTGIDQQTRLRLS
jgi:pimeloyl-ACP methyl ester carboxylesterase